jgi:hypothetical protein
MHKHDAKNNNKIIIHGSIIKTSPINVTTIGPTTYSSGHPSANANNTKNINMKYCCIHNNYIANQFTFNFSVMFTDRKMMAEISLYEDSIFLSCLLTEK